MWRNFQVKRSEKGKPNSKLNSSKKKFKYVILFITWLSACISHPILKETSLIHCRSKVWNFTIKWILYIILQCSEIQLNLTEISDQILSFLFFFFLAQWERGGDSHTKRFTLPPLPGFLLLTWMKSYKVSIQMFSCFNFCIIFMLKWIL